MTDIVTPDDNSRPSWRRRLLLAAAILLVAAAGWLGFSGYRAWRAATALRTDLRAAQALTEADPRDLDPQEAAALLASTRANLKSLHSATRPFLWAAPHLGWVPRWGPTIQAAPVLLDIGLGLTAAGEQLADTLLPLLEEDPDDGAASHPSQISLATATLAEAGPRLEEALAAAEDARSALEGLDIDALDGRIQPWVARLQEYLPLVEQGTRAMLLAPELLGAHGPRTYLVLVQNEDELRATGGFISGVARLTLDHGRIQAIHFEDSYAVDDFSVPYPDPPDGLSQTMLADLWVFRDSNWSPDFPTAAEQAVELYLLSRDAVIDGVIGLDQRAISLLLGPLGPLTVEETDEPVTGQNVIEVARRAWDPGEEIAADWWIQRKDIMHHVLDAALGQLEGRLERGQVVDLGSAALEALREKHMLVHLADPDGAAALRELGWDGSLASPAGDYLMVVESNVGFNKVNAVVEAALDYDVDLTDPQRPRATLTVRHRHPVDDWSSPCSQQPRYSATYEGMTARCYYNYLRAYVPSGAHLVGATPHAVDGRILLSGESRPGEVEVYAGEEDRTVFATFLVVEPGEALETAFVYDLPAGAVERTDAGWRYRLTIQKQPGTRGHPVEATLRLPAGAAVESTDPPPSQADGGILRYQLDLRTDVALEVIWTAQPDR